MLNNTLNKKLKNTLLIATALTSSLTFTADAYAGKKGKRYIKAEKAEKAATAAVTKATAAAILAEEDEATARETLNSKKTAAAVAAAVAAAKAAQAAQKEAVRTVSEASKVLSANKVEQAKEKAIEVVHQEKAKQAKEKARIAREAAEKARIAREAAITEQEKAEFLGGICNYLDEEEREQAEAEAAKNTHAKDTSKPKMEQIDSFVSTENDVKKLLESKGVESIMEVTEHLENKGIIFSQEDVNSGYDDSSMEKPKDVQARLYAADLLNLPEEVREAEVKKAQAAAQKQAEVTRQLNEIATTAMNSRMDDIMPQPATSLAPAAGDEASFVAEKGVWVSGMLGKNIQKKHGNNASYKADIAGGIIGADCQLTESSLAGVFYSNSNANFKYSKDLQGNSLKANSHIFGIYAAHELKNNLFLEGIVATGFSKIDNQRKQMVSGTEHKIAKSKLYNRSYSADLGLTYNHVVANNVVISPSAGVRYSHFADDASTEKGAGVHNIHTNKKNGSNVEGRIGAKLAMHKKISDSLTIIPSVKASVEHLLSSKQSKIQAKYNWSDNYFDTAADAGKADKTKLNLNFGVLAKIKNNLELSAGYNLSLRKKYQGHQGNLKLKVMF
ncbi:MAG: hypothetical protein Tsb006_4350 [Rickettsiaceae bacterium]